ncbi:7250_t:CDS:2, partial [Racocetra persica]
MLNLEAPKVVLITRENFIKILRVNKQNGKKIAIDNEEESSNLLTEIVIQESAQNSSFDVEADSTLSINNQISNDSIDLIPIQCADSLSDEYFNSDEENDEWNFDAALTLLHNAKETIKTNERFDKVNDGRVSSNLIEDSPLKSMNEALVTMKFKCSKNTSNKVNELTVGDKCDEVKDIQMNQQDNTIHECGGLQRSNKMVNLLQTSNDPEFGEETDTLLPNSYSSINITIITSQAQAKNNRKSIESMLSDEEVDELLYDSYSQINIAQAENNREMDKQPSINFISGMLKQMTLAENSTQADDIGSIQDNDYEKDQETGRWRQNPDTNEWNSLFVKGKTIKTQVYKIIKEEALGIIKEEARIRDEMIVAQHSFMLVLRLGWN